jgi:hypothetical protein
MKQNKYKAAASLAGRARVPSNILAFSNQILFFHAAARALFLPFSRPLTGLSLSPLCECKCVHQRHSLFLYLSLRGSGKINFIFQLCGGTQRYLPPHHQGIYDSAARALYNIIIYFALYYAAHHISTQEMGVFRVHQ